MKKLLVIVTICLLGCNNNSKESEQLAKEKELLAKEKELFEKEKSLSQTIPESKTEKSVKIKSGNNRIREDAYSIDSVEIPNANRVTVIDEIQEPNLEFIRRDLIGREVKYKKRSWRFDALSEFKNIVINKKERSSNYYEAVLDIDLEDYKSGKDYFVRILISYNLEDKWNFRSVDAINIIEK